MKESENIDDIFSDALSNFGVEPPENLQESIAGKRKNIEPEEGGNGRNYFFIIIGAMVLLFATLFFVSDEQQKIAEAKSKMISNEAKINSSTSNDKFQKENKTESLNSNSNIDSTSNNTSNIDSINSSNSINSGNDTYVKNDVIISNQHISIKEKSKIKSKKSISKFRNASTNKKTNSQKHLGDEKAFNSNLSSKTSLVQSLDYSDSSKINQTESSKNESNVISNSKGISDSITISKSVFDSLKANSSDSIKAINTVAKEEITEDSKIKSHKWVWFIEPSAGVCFSKNKFSSDNQMALNLLKDSVKIVQPGMAYAINVGIQKNKLVFKSGIGIQQWSEQLGNSYISQKYVAAIGDSIIINGTDTIVKHNIPIQILADVRSANSNKTSYTFINLPLIVGYSTKFNKLELNYNFGFIYSLLLKSKGNYLHLTTKSATNYTRKQYAPLNAQRLMILLSVDAMYAISERSKLVVCLPLNIALTSHYSNEYAIKRRMNTLGINLGYRFTF